MCVYVHNVFFSDELCFSANTVKTYLIFRGGVDFWCFQKSGGGLTTPARSARGGKTTAARSAWVGGIHWATEGRWGGFTGRPKAAGGEGFTGRSSDQKRWYVIEQSNCFLYGWSAVDPHPSHSRANKLFWLHPPHSLAEQINFLTTFPPTSGRPTT